MKSINQYIIENKDFQRSFNESQDKYFTQQEIGKIIKDMNDKNGQFYAFMKDKVDRLTDEYIEDYLYNQCLDDDRCAAEFASYIEMIIGRHNYSLEQVQQFINTEDLKG